MLVSETDSRAEGIFQTAVLPFLFGSLLILKHIYDLCESDFPIHDWQDHRLGNSRGQPSRVAPRDSFVGVCHPSREDIQIHERTHVDALCHEKGIPPQTLGVLTPLRPLLLAASPRAHPHSVPSALSVHLDPSAHSPNPFCPQVGNQNLFWVQFQRFKLYDWGSDSNLHSLQLCVLILR